MAPPGCLGFGGLDMRTRQKGGSVWSHLQIAANPAHQTVRSVRRRQPGTRLRWWCFGYQKTLDTARTGRVVANTHSR